jgi:Putative rhamnosyl transferase
MVSVLVSDESSSLSSKESRHNKTRRVKTKTLMCALSVAVWCLFASIVCSFFFFVVPPENVKQATPQQTRSIVVRVREQEPRAVKISSSSRSWSRPPPSSQDHHRLRHMAQLNTQWDNRYKIVHVILMRFMQLQPDLLRLGQARLDLFHAITLPSIMQQTSQDFLLIIRTDPDLHPVLKESMLATLRRVPNAVLVGSNKVVEGFREVGMVDINATSIMSGSLALVQSYHDMAQEKMHIVLETRLDADDALSLTFVETIQRRAHKIWVAKKDEGVRVPREVADNSDWRVWCPGPHINWLFYSPWDGKSMTGSLVPMPSTKACITPGLTFGFQVNAKFVDVGVRQHQLLHSHLKRCEERPTRCLERLSGGEEAEPVALRARAPTSAGMKDVVPTILMTNTTNSKDLMKAVHHGIQESQLWASLPDLFGLNPASIWAMRFRMEANLPAMIADGLLGQCTGGHSCKNSSAVALRSLLNMSLGGVNSNM